MKSTVIKSNYSDGATKKYIPSKTTNYFPVNDLWSNETSMPLVCKNNNENNDVDEDTLSGMFFGFGDVEEELVLDEETPYFQNPVFSLVFSDDISEEQMIESHEICLLEEPFEIEDVEKDDNFKKNTRNNNALHQ